MGPLFRLEGLSFSYNPGCPVLDELCFRLDPGEKVALAGPNGAGKTTLFHLMVGLLTPTGGTIEAFGAIRRGEKDFKEVRARAGILFQDSDDQLFCPTVAEDVAFGPLNLGKRPAEARAIVAETLAMLGLTGFETRITHTLSGGQKRLVALATVLAMRPDVLLLDEPTNALDEATESLLTDILAGLPQAMVVISHDTAFLDRIATRRVRLDRGRLAP
ncbi:energy-coupling factor ABC transporter ATP-binding protein [Magnetospirillum fulvum]|uniref:Cobalt/nickel transport system ATP-binding protein n=1 Tax=Magnetospirillum fulvum TaxID=1082 RepID=A0A1H6HGN8_MAGFU|nr:ABC transporter ATP-binding protein [Magnetospirillum fulvum]SEH34931.1 cobalt/nickel transport system ATP-binding protein [Magnetospirillum fulvum]